MFQIKSAPLVSVNYYAAFFLLAPAFYAYRDFKTPAWGAFLSLMINLVLNTLFVFDMKALSIALATGISSWINITFLYKKLKQQFGPIISHNGIVQLTKIAIATIGAGIITWFFQCTFFLPPTFFHFFQEAQSAMPTNVFDQIVSVAAPGSFYLVMILAISWIIKADDLLILCRLKKEKETPSTL